jgi:type II secretory pathway pseudopilin PulG
MRVRRDHARGGYSIVEATLAVLLIGGAMVAAANVAITASRANGAATQRRQAERLAHMLLAEAMNLPAAGSDATTTNGGPRLNDFDHLLDFDGFRETPMRTIDGRVFGPTGWAWAITLTPRGSDTVDGRSLNLRMYQVTSTVELPDGTVVSVRALRGNSASAERVPVVNTDDITQVLIKMELADGTVLDAAPRAGALAPPNAPSRSAVVQ